MVSLKNSLIRLAHKHKHLEKPIQNILASALGAKWRMPTESELSYEFTSEPSLRDYYAIQFHWLKEDINDIKGSPYRLFLSTLRDVSDVVTFTSLPHNIEFHEANTLDELKVKIRHMSKDIDSLAHAMLNNQPLPYPILIKKSSKLEMIGDRTRFGIANILNVPVQALVIDETKLKEVVGNFVWHKFLHDPESAFLKGISPHKRKDILSWALKGSKSNKPKDIFKPETPAFTADVMLDSWYDQIQKAVSIYGYPKINLSSSRQPKSAATIPVPTTFPKHEIGIMNLKEFLAFRNPEGKYHPSNAYDFDLFKMNEDWNVSYLGATDFQGKRYTFYQSSLTKAFLIKEERNYLQPVAVFSPDGTLYYEGSTVPPIYWWDRDNFKELPVVRAKQVKYIHEYVSIFSDIAKQNQDSYPHIIQRIKSGTEFLEIRAQRPPKLNEGTSLAILNSEGLKVAIAQDEWNTTLISVAQEYRGRKLGKIIGKVWYEYNPKYLSGGMTISGEANAINIWQDRVNEFLDRGWYSELVKQKRLSPSKVKDILSGLKKKPKDTNLPSPKDVPPIEDKSEPELLIYSDMQSTFIVYDKRFLTDQDDKYIYGAGLIQDSTSSGPFFYYIEYERKYHKLTTYVGFQLARDNGEKIYVGDNFTDVLELDGLAHIKQDQNYAYLTKDVMNLKSLSKHESRLRKSVDPFEEIKVYLLEMADVKWR